MQGFTRIIVRLKDRWISLSAAVGVLAIVACIIMARTDRSSGGSVIALAMLIVIAAALGTSGVLWLRFQEVDCESDRCRQCGYDLRELPRSATARCPECGHRAWQKARQSEDHQLSDGISNLLVSLPGMLLVLGAILVLLAALFYWSAWMAGGLGDL